jgi:hypothetical protein
MDFNKISKIIERYRILLFNSIETNAIRTLVAQHGYDENKLKEGIALYEDTVKLLTIRESSMTDHVNAALLFNKEFIRIKELFKNIVNISRRVFLPVPEGMALLPETTYINDFDALKVSVSKLYNGILKMPQLSSRLIRYGHTEEILKQELKAIASLEKMKIALKVKNTDLQIKTAKRDEKLKELQNFCNTYQEVATKALLVEPLLLERIGIKVLKKYVLALRPPKEKREKRPKKQ